MIVLFLKRRGGKKACGANFLLLSQNGNASKQTPPMTSMAIMLLFLQPLFAFGASVSGSKISEMAAANSSKPKVSKSNHRFLRFSTIVWPWNGLGTSIPMFFARRWFMKRLAASGMKHTGKMIAHMAYPHLHVAVLRIAAPTSGPAQVVHRNGTSNKVEKSARLRRSVESATKICCRTARPLNPAAQKICAPAKD